MTDKIWKPDWPGNIAFIVLVIAVVFLVILFAGEPDLHDKIVDSWGICND